MSQEITIISGNEARTSLTNPNLILLTNRVNQRNTNDQIGFLRHEVGRAIFEILRKGKWAHTIRQHIDPAFQPIEHMKTLRDRCDIVVAKVGKRIVGMAGFECCGQDPESNRSVYEIRRIGVRKEFERQGIGSKLHKTAFDNIRGIDPQALILVEAWHPKIMQQCQRMGYKECDVVNGLVKKGWTIQEATNMVPWYEEKGYKFFVYDPYMGG